MPPPGPRQLVTLVASVVLVLSSCVVVLGIAPATAATPSGATGASARAGEVAGVSSQAGAGTAARAAVPAARRPHHPTKAERARAARLKAERAAKKKAAKKKAAAAKKKAAAAKRAAKKKAAAERRARARLKARWARVKPGNPRTWLKTAPSRRTPWDGPRFNNPYGSTAHQRALIDKVVRAIDASPGYQTYNPITKKTMSCPTDPKYAPSVIKIAVYSIADMRFADALVAAHRRCVSVQVLMNSHLTGKTSHSWRKIIRALGRRGTTYRHRTSFAHRCSHGCLGTAVLHSKFFLFSHAGSARHTVMVGSTNMARNATNIQFNDLYTVNGNATLYAQYRHMFEAMVPDRTEPRKTPPHVFRAGPYTSTFYPFFHATERTDRTMKALRSIHCGGADGGAGIHGHTVVYIAMHSWFGDRGDYLARRVRQMYDRGCYVRILYSFMSARIHGELTWGTGSRMVARRVLFPGPHGVVASKYSHMKMFAASGHVGSDHSSWVVWTGSNNFSDRGLRADDVTLRIPIKSVYDVYVHHWKYMKKRRSSSVWALFQEPSGGGRAPTGA